MKIKEFLKNVKYKLYFYQFVVMIHTIFSYFFSFNGPRKKWRALASLRTVAHETRLFQVQTEVGAKLLEIIRFLQ